MNAVSKNQRGSALIVSLIILLIMTILGVQGMQSSTLEEKMSGNFRDRALAFEAAEAALKAAEGWLNLQTNPPPASDTGATNVWTFGTPDLSSYSTWSTNGVEATTGLTEGAGALSQAPQYIIEERGVITGFGQNSSAEIGAVTQSSASGTSYGYRITARGVGSTPNSVVILQSNYEKIY